MAQVFLCACAHTKRDPWCMHLSDRLDTEALQQYKPESPEIRNSYKQLLKFRIASN
jgi:hypothetical protein